MAIGAKDQLDLALVKKYKSLRMDNPIVGNSMVEPDKMFEAMNDYAQMHKNMLEINQKLHNTCIGAISMNIEYRKSKPLPTRTSA